MATTRSLLAHFFLGFTLLSLQGCKTLKPEEAPAEDPQAQPTEAPLPELGADPVDSLTEFYQKQDALAAEAAAAAEKKGTDPLNPVHVGKILMVNPEMKFALIDGRIGHRPPVQATLVTRDSLTGAITATMRVGPERQREILTVDFVSGTPVVGEPVYWVNKKSVPTF